jgi:uncharacterized protein (TIGR02246 family)
MHDAARIHAEIDLTFAEWKAAGRRGDAEAMAALVTEDGEFWSHGRPALKGREAVRQAFLAAVAEYDIEQEWESVERIIAGDWALDRGIERNVVIKKSDGTRIEVTQRGFSVLRKESDGWWRFARGMTNQEA